MLVKIVAFVRHNHDFMLTVLKKAKLWVLGSAS